MSLTTASITTLRQPPRCRLSLGLFGCPLDTGNRGVSALGLSLIRGLAATGAVDVTLFDYGRGERAAELWLDERPVVVRQVSCFHSRRYYRMDNLAQMYFAARLGGARLHPMLRRLRELDAILDVSGGDSFSDLYGHRRFHAIALPKLVAIKLDLPLVLLPQTYGPYMSRPARSVAKRILEGAEQVWSRDMRSLEVVRELLGDGFDPSRHRCGVDVAFGLPAREPRDRQLIDRSLALKSRGQPLIGLNVSGLLYNRAGEDQNRYRFLGCYRRIINKLLDRLLELDGVRVLLVSHVAPECGSADCDASAIRTIGEPLSGADAERVLVVPPTLQADELKWVIGRCDWFCGTRMHACIAAISQGVPAVAIAYSDKTAGVFETAGVEHCVVDPREVAEDEVVERILQGLHEREAVRRMLLTHLPEIRARLVEQFEAILACVHETARA